MSLRIGIAGAGIGGLSAALALSQQGHQVSVYERAQELNRVGADVNLTPNAVSALDGLGCGEQLRDLGARPTFRISRDGISGEELSRLPMSDAAQEKYGAPQLTIHRADLLTTLLAALPPATLHLNQAVAGVSHHPDNSVLTFTDKTVKSFDLVVGADGIHSVVRDALFGPDEPGFTGLVSYRAVFRREDAPELKDTDAFTKWWGDTPDLQIVTFPLTRGKEIFVFATTPAENWTEEGWTLPGDVTALRKAYAHFHPDARALLAACREVTCSALHVREPMSAWSIGHTTLLGDAAHPMVPFMAQGACMSIEDAVILSRALAGTQDSDVEIALSRYEAARRSRTATVQRMSLENEWMRKPGNADWLYGYNAWETGLTDAA